MPKDPDILDFEHISVLILAGGTSIMRTVKLLAAITSGVDVVSKTWLLHSVKAAKFLEPSDEYIPRFIASEKKWNFTIQSSLHNARKARLAGGIFGQSWFWLSFKKADGLPAPNDVKKLIKASGGEVVDTLREITDLSQSKTCIIVATSKEIKSAAAQKAVENGCYIMPVFEFILTLLRQSLTNDLEALRQKNAPPASKSKSSKLRETLRKLSPIKSNKRTPAPTATEPKTTGLASVADDEVRANPANNQSTNQDTSSTNGNASNLWAYQTPKKAASKDKDTVSASNGPLKMTFSARNNQKIILQLRLVRSPWRSTSKKHEKRELGANGEAFIVDYTDTDTQEMAYILNGGSLMFQAKVPKEIESSGVFKRIGGIDADAFYWDVNNDAHEAGGTTIKGPMTPGLHKSGHRRYYFFFQSHPECVVFMYHLFRKDLMLVNKFFAPDSVFATDVEPRLPHAVIADEDDMVDGDDDFGDNDEKKFDDNDDDYGYDPYAASQR